MKELIILVDEHNSVIGEIPKAEVHHKNTPLHRGFSAFLFTRSGELLLQQRSAKKVTWPLIWSNSCCGHPRLYEPLEQTVKQRITFELGLTISHIYIVLPDYRYRYEHKGIVENEFCPVLVGFTDKTPQPNPDEVAAVRYTPWREFLAEIKQPNSGYSEWCIEEALLLEKNELFQKLWKEQIH